jgi:hypothetical protein
MWADIEKQESLQRRTKMRKTICTFAFLVGMVMCGLVPVAHAADYLPDEVLVQLRPGTDINVFSRDHGLEVLARSPYTLSFRLRVPPDEDIDNWSGCCATCPR